MNAYVIIGIIAIAYLAVKNGVVTLPSSVQSALNTPSAFQSIAGSSAYADSGLKVGMSQGQGLQTAGSVIEGSASATGPAAPYVMAAGAVIAFAGSIFKGADPRQVPASQIEQTYEALADNLYALFANARMITRDLAVGGMQAAITAVQDALATSGLGVAAQKALVNAVNVIQAEMQAAQNLPDAPATMPIDTAAARQYYIGQGVSAPGWYDIAVQKAATLTDQFLNGLTSS